MAWFGGKKKSKKKPPVLEPVGAPAVQAAPVQGNQAIPAIQAAPAVQAAPVVQAAPAVQATPAAQEPVVEIAPIGAIADNTISVSAEPAQTQTPSSTEWAKKSVKPLFDIHKKLDHMMDSKGKSLEERYKDRFGDKLPDSVAADSARKELKEKKEIEEAKPKILFKKASELNLKPKAKKAPKAEKKKKEEIVEIKPSEKSESIGSKIGSGIKSGGTKTKAAFGRAGAAVGRGAGAVKSGIGRGTSKVMGLFKRGKKEETKAPVKKKGTKKRGRPSKKVDYKSMKLPELKAELKKKSLPISGNKAELIKRLQK